MEVIMKFKGNIIIQFGKHTIEIYYPHIRLLGVRDKHYGIWMQSCSVINFKNRMNKNRMKAFAIQLLGFGIGYCYNNICEIYNCIEKNYI
jgi:hypothetical protein